MLDGGGDEDNTQLQPILSQLYHKHQQTIDEQQRAANWPKNKGFLWIWGAKDIKFQRRKYQLFMTSLIEIFSLVVGFWVVWKTIKRLRLEE